MGRGVAEQAEGPVFRSQALLKSQPWLQVPAVPELGSRQGQTDL